MVDLEFTGERLVPGKVETELEIEHASRYHLAARHARGREVLDFGCGTGYGSAILKGGGALRVVGIDRAPEAVRYAATRFGGPGVTFLAGDCLCSAFPRERFDVVVAYEVIEHVEGYRRFLREVRRLLRPDGILLLSTPNRRTYRRGADTPPNPFHVHEFRLRELRRALAEVFPAVAILGQSRTEGAYFYADETAGSGAADGLLSLVVGEGARGAGRLEAADYFFALCGGDPAALSAAPTGGSFFIADDNAVQRRNRRIVELQGELEGRTRWVRQLQAELAGSADRSAALQSRIEAVERTLGEAARESEQTARRLEAQLGNRVGAAVERAAADLGALRAALARHVEQDRDRDAILRWHRDTLARQQGELERHRRDLFRRQEQEGDRLAELNRRLDGLGAQLEQLSRRADHQDATIASQAERMVRVEQLTTRARELIDMLWGARSWTIYTGLRRLLAALVPRRAGRGADPRRRPAEAGNDEPSP